MTAKMHITGLAICLLAALTSCQKFDQDELHLAANMNLYKTLINCTYTDATTGLEAEIRPGSGMKVEVLNSHTGQIVEISSGKFQTVYTPNYPFVTFGLNPYGQIPSGDSPVTLLLKTTHPDYLDNYTTVTISEERIVNREIRLFNRHNPPEGMELSTFSDVVGLDDEGAAVDSADIVSSSGKVIVRIPKGVVLKNNQGQPLTGSLSLELLTADPSTEEGRMNVPGLFQPLITQDGVVSRLINPITYYRIVLRDEQGTVATTLEEQSIELITLVESSFSGSNTSEWEQSNMKGSTPMIPGDTDIPGYHFNQASGDWQSAGPGGVTQFQGQTAVNYCIAPGPAIEEITQTLDQDEPIDRIELVILGHPDLAFGSRSVKLRVCRYDPDIKSPVAPHINPNAIIQELIPSTTLELGEGVNLFIIKDLAPQEDTYRFILSNMEGTASVNKDYTLQQLQAEKKVHFDINDVISLLGSLIDRTTIYTEFSCTPTTGNPIYLRYDNIPASFFLLVSGTNFDRETTIQVNKGSFTLPFNPIHSNDASWQVKVVMGDMEYPEGDERVTVTSKSHFYSFNGRVVFDYRPNDPEGCIKLKQALNLD